MKSQKYELFMEMMEGFKTDNVALFNHGARCLVDLEEGNPFPEDSEARDHFHRMKSYYAVCQRGGINQRANLRLLYEEAKALCKLNPEPPYKKEEPDKESVIEPVKEPDIIPEPVAEVEIKAEPAVEPPVVLGALEESVNKPKRKSFLKR